MGALDASVHGPSDRPHRHPVYRSRFAAAEEARFMPVERYDMFYKMYEDSKSGGYLTSFNRQEINCHE